MECPYCGVRFSLAGVPTGEWFAQPDRSPHRRSYPTSHADDRLYKITYHRCPDCDRQIMWLIETEIDDSEPLAQFREVSTTLLFPKHRIKQLPDAVPEQFAIHFREAHDTLPISERASAALSRRSLQDLIRQMEGITKSTLHEEIKELLARHSLPRYLADDLDAVRAVGNFAAHPIKDTNTGQIVEVEPCEAQWTLQILEKLLIFYFVDEPNSKARREALDEKLRAAGRPPMLQP